MAEPIDPRHLRRLIFHYLADPRLGDDGWAYPVRIAAFCSGAVGRSVSAESVAFELVALAARGVVTCDTKGRYAIA